MTAVDELRYNVELGIKLKDLLELDREFFVYKNEGEDNYIEDFSKEIYLSLKEIYNRLEKAAITHNKTREHLKNVNRLDSVDKEFSKKLVDERNALINEICPLFDEFNDLNRFISSYQKIKPNLRLNHGFEKSLETLNMDLETIVNERIADGSIFCDEIKDDIDKLKSAYNVFYSLFPDTYVKGSANKPIKIVDMSHDLRYFMHMCVFFNNLYEIIKTEIDEDKIKLDYSHTKKSIISEFVDLFHDNFVEKDIKNEWNHDDFISDLFRFIPDELEFKIKYDENSLFENLGVFNQKEAYNKIMEDNLKNIKIRYSCLNKYSSLYDSPQELKLKKGYLASHLGHESLYTFFSIIEVMDKLLKENDVLVKKYYFLNEFADTTIGMLHGCADSKQYVAGYEIIECIKQNKIWSENYDSLSEQQKHMCLLTEYKIKEGIEQELEKSKNEKDYLTYLALGLMYKPEDASINGLKKIKVEIKKEFTDQDIKNRLEQIKDEQYKKINFRE